MDPFFTPLLIAGGLNLGAGLLGSLMRPKTPDFTGAVVNQAGSALRGLEEDEERAVDRLEGDLAAAGATGFQGVGAREAIARASGDQRAQIMAAIADQLAQAQMAEEQAKVGIHNANVDARRNALYNIASAGGTAALMGAFRAPTTGLEGTPVPASVPQVAALGPGSVPSIAPNLTELGRVQLPDLQRILFEQANRDYLTGR